MALYSGFHLKHKLAGIIALSTFMPLAESLVPEVIAANLDTPVWLGHGEHDDVVPVEATYRTKQILGALGNQASLSVYPIAHEVCEPEIDDIDQWLQKRLVANEK